MKILMILANPFTHDPRVYNEAMALIKAGHGVTVLAWDRKKQHPSKEKKEDINVVRIINTRFMDFLPYDIFRLHFWWTEGVEKALELQKKNPFDVVHCHDLSALPIGVKLKKKLGLPLIYDAHEIWGYMVAKDLPKWWANYYLWKEKKFAPIADHIITVAEPHEQHFQNMGCNKVSIIRNCKEVDKNEYMQPDNGIFTLVYIGGLGEGRFLRESVEICQGLDGMQFRIAGFGILGDVLKQTAKNAPFGNIEFLGIIPMERVIPETAKGDVILCMLNPSNMNNRIGPPNKLFEAMAAGRPVIATKGTYSGNLVEELKMGLAIDFDEKSLKSAIIKLRDDPKLREEFGKNALKAALGEYNWKLQEKKLLNVYDQMRGVR
jgi:glycosyltransferase involved in cell wall biosynthesis